MELPINQAVLAGETLYIGGVVSTDYNENVLEKGNFSGQVKVVIKKLVDILNSANMTLDNLVFVNMYISKMSFLEELNDLYAILIPEPYPARKVLEIKFTINDIMVELTAIASLKKKVIT